MSLASRRSRSVRPAASVTDSLEPRRLLAASVNFAGGTLSIVGTDASETIVVAPAAGDATSVSVTVDGSVLQTVALSGLNLIDIQGGRGDDNITVSQSITVRGNLRGGYDRDTIQGGGGQDFIAGEKGNDTVRGGGGNDLITGGAGKNTLYGEDGDDKAVGGDGVDRIYGGAGKDRLYGNLGDDLIDGGGGADRLYGSSDNDTLYGGTGNDRIYGNSEADTLGGGRGRDTLIGGENAGDDVAFADDEDVLSQIEIVK